jgi:aspartyl-tRNA(Asn)/glutamyl-tRNA(Gln) amidotransferase subunit C
MMPTMETKDIKHLASLARIRIADAEAEALKKDIDSVLDYVSVVSDIAAADGLTKKVGARYNVFRTDAVTNEPGVHTETLLQEAPAREGNYLKVKKILSQD